ncbi:hypothetical protein [Subtercola sp. RTI3]|uniref:hypothetical protein n=1 Tax=Subtercola sp. RTI3 TaxID=3048639 RepID=UPI002B2350CB|nr:hypothetical protein [Subtercola sp. RTI3]MEA9986253.1 hypothetical protein [Subtercola sp. RTI3]
MTTDTRGLNRRIKDALVTILSSLQYDAGSGAEDAFVDVVDNTRDAFEGSPIARVLPDGFASTPGSNSQNDHTPKFDVIVSWPLEDPSDVESALYDQLYDITDLIVNKVEHDDWVDELTQIDPNIQNWIMDIGKVSWRIASGKSGALLLLEIVIGITYSQDL